MVRLHIIIPGRCRFYIADGVGQNVLMLMSCSVRSLKEVSNEVEVTNEVSEEVDDTTRSITSGSGRKESGDGVSHGPAGPTRRCATAVQSASRQTSTQRLIDTTLPICGMM